VGRAVSHYGPFLSCGVCNIAADQAAKLRFRVFRKSSSENYNSSQRASLAIDFRFGLFGVSPNLARGERNEKGKDDTQGRQQTGGDDRKKKRGPFSMPEIDHVVMAITAAEAIVRHTAPIRRLELPQCLRLS